MTDRHKGYIVIIDRDIREDDAESILQAIQMIKHVIKVEPLIEHVISVEPLTADSSDVSVSGKNHQTAGEEK